MKDNKDQKPKFKNTRSKFYTKQPSFENEEKQEKQENYSQLTSDHWKQKGNQMFRIGKYKVAIAYYSKAIDINEGESQYYSNRSKCYMKLGQLVEALKDAQTACELNEENIKAHYICGCILAEMGKQDANKLKKAQNRLNKAFRLCRTLSMTQFEQQISIRIYRLKKVMWFKEREAKLKLISFEKEILNKASLNNIYSEKDCNQLMKEITEREKLLREKPDIPDHLICKITLQLMEDPVISDAGFTYERNAIEQHFKSRGFIEPLTRNSCSGKLYPNQAIKQAIEEYLSAHPWAFELDSSDDYTTISF